ncbi:MAG TPA: alkaline phosphatase family protein [Candidatus Binatia bacterium]|nr:alkaline phosphatase family protein [Candidatus Binatia bacterium]
MRVAPRALAATFVAAVTLASCGGGSTSGSLPQRVAPESASGSGYIQHVVIVIQENRSFDDFFSSFPNADGTQGGCMKPPTARIAPAYRFAAGRISRPRAGSGGCPSGDEYVPLTKTDLPGKCDWSHSYKNVGIDYDDGAMDGFGLEGGGKNCPGKVGTTIYQYVDPAQIAPYWDIAEQYVLADHMFQTQGSGSFTAHQDLIAAGTIINKAQTKSLVDFPSHMPWGCDAAKGTKTSQLLYTKAKIKDQYHKGPFPCLEYATMRDLLDAKSVSWKYYSPPEPNGTGALWNGFDAIDAVRNGPEWKTNIAQPKVFFSDITNGTLPAVSWIVPDDNNSDHPAVQSDTGPSWVASIVNAVGQSNYWDSTAVIVVWDDWGGFYDHEPPPFFDNWGGLGFRVPMLVVSAYAREATPSVPGYISHTPYEFGSILKFTENVFDLGSLGTTDKRATSIADCFDFSQPPRAFSAIPSKYSLQYFLRQPPSYKPLDSE